MKLSLKVNVCKRFSLTSGTESGSDIIVPHSWGSWMALNTIVLFNLSFLELKVRIVLTL